jgi:hypothetical protein
VSVSVLVFREPDRGFRLEQDAQLRGRALAVSHFFGECVFGSVDDCHFLFRFELVSGCPLHQLSRGHGRVLGTHGC